MIRLARGLLQLIQGKKSLPEMSLENCYKLSAFKHRTAHKDWHENGTQDTSAVSFICEWQVAIKASRWIFEMVLAGRKSILHLLPI